MFKMKFLAHCFVFMLLVVHSTAEDLNCYNCGSNNPCGRGNSQLFFRFCQNPSYYVQCGEADFQCNYQYCSYGTMWSQVQAECVDDPSLPLPRPGPTYPSPPCPPGKYNCYDKNPCTIANAAGGNFHFDHEKPGKYVKCDNFRTCSEMECPDGKAWEAVSCICV